MRIYELAKQIGVANKEILRYLPTIGVQAKSHSSSIDPEAVREVIRHFRPEPPPEPKGEVVEDRPKKKKPKHKRPPKAKHAGAPTDAPAATEEGPASAAEAERLREGATPTVEAPELRLTEGLTVKDLAERMHRTPAEVIQTLLSLGVIATINQRVPLEAAELVASEFGFRAVAEELAGAEALAREDEGPAEPRPPIVTVMGHVDHGKTLLLDKIRSSDVAGGEAGGITQHIGAYTVQTPKGRVTFLDTPGHEAFTAMRARGASVTDIALLVVAADDGVMPQTVEAIQHAKAAGVRIVVAINKCDLPDANPDRVLSQLPEHGLEPEPWGGDVQVVRVSAKTGAGIDELLEALLIEAELLELKAPVACRARGVVIEATLDPKVGATGTLLVQAGTLKVGDALLVGTTPGKARALIDAEGKRITETGPATAVKVIGLSEVPQVGDPFEAVEDERQARKLAEARARQYAAGSPGRSQKFTLEDLAKISSGEEKTILRIIVRADALGSVEAIRDALERIEHDKVGIEILHASVGAITDNDVNLAASSKALIVGFGVRPTASAERLADSFGVEIRTYKVIYELLDDVEKALAGLLAPVAKAETIGRVEVRKTFKISGVGVVAGCSVQEGVVRRNAAVRLVRDGVVVYEGRVASLKRFQDDVREVTAGYECGIGLADFHDVKAGDVIEVLQVTETAQAL